MLSKPYASSFAIIKMNQRVGSRKLSINTFIAKSSTAGCSYKLGYL